MEYGVLGGEKLNYQINSAKHKILTQQKLPLLN